jgi:hypothetical protein
VIKKPRAPYAFLLTCSVLIIGCLAGQELSRFSAEFYRDTNRHGRSDSSNGEVYYSNERIIIKVKNPIRQWIEVKPNLTRLYYPDRAQCISLQSKQEGFVNFINTFLAAIYEDYNLTKQGYMLFNTVFKGDTLYSSWRTDKTKVNFTLVHYKNRLCRVESSDEERHFITSVAFSNHILFEGRYYPTRLVFLQNYQGHTSREEINLCRIVFNKPFPERIEKFKIPDDVETKIVEW